VVFVFVRLFAELCVFLKNKTKIGRLLESCNVKVQTKTKTSLKNTKYDPKTGRPMRGSRTGSIPEAEDEGPVTAAAGTPRKSAKNSKVVDRPHRAFV
jgi:hypothetical protein